MTNRTIVLDGNNFSDLATFYDEVERVMTKDLDWKIGRNLNAFNDVLRGGFGVHEYEEPYTLQWINSEKSSKDFGYPETVKYMEQILTICHPSNKKELKKELELAKKQQGPVLFDDIIGIIKGHDHVTLLLS